MKIFIGTIRCPHCGRVYNAIRLFSGTTPQIGSFILCSLGCGAISTWNGHATVTMKDEDKIRLRSVPMAAQIRSRQEEVTKWMIG